MSNTTKSLEATLNAKGGGVFKNGDSVSALREQSPYMEELLFMQLGAKVVDLSKFMKDMHQVIKNMLKAISVLYNIAGGKRSSKAKAEIGRPNSDPSDTYPSCHRPVTK